MALRLLPSPELLRQLLRYDPETGLLWWKERSLDLFVSPAVGRAWNTKYAGKRALSSELPTGYLFGRIFDKPYYAHRVIWVMHHGANITEQIDHIDGCKSNNRIENLRSVNARINCKNARLSKANTSGVSGVVKSSVEGRWTARIKVNYEYIHLGSFATIEEAATARKAAERQYGFHPNHGRAA